MRDARRCVTKCSHGQQSAFSRDYTQTEKWRAGVRGGKSGFIRIASSYLAVFNQTSLSTSNIPAAPVNAAGVPVAMGQPVYAAQPQTVLITTTTVSPGGARGECSV